MISNPTNIVATPKTVGAVASNVLEYENEESLEAEMEVMLKVSRGEDLSLDNTQNIQNYYNNESGVLRLTGSWANRHKMAGEAVDSNIMENFIKGASPDGKQAPRYQKSHDGIMKYDYVMDMTYSSNKYINTGFAISDVDTKEKIKDIHNKGNDTLTKLLDDFWLVEVNDKYIKPLSRIEAQVDHYKSRSDELLLHKHRLTHRGCEVILEDGSVGYRLLDEAFIKNGSNRLMMDIICKNSELNECIEKGIDVSVVDKELSSVTGDTDMSFYKINAFSDLPELFGTEQKIIHETYNESLSKWQTELVKLLTQPTRSEKDRDRIKVLESKIDKKNKTRELSYIAKDIRSEKSSSNLDDICRKQLDKVLLKYPNFKPKSIFSKNANAQKKTFKIGVQLSENEIKELLNIVFDKQHSVDQLRVTAMIANTHKGRFSYEQLNKQFEVIQKKYLKSNGLNNGLNVYISKQHIFTQIHFQNQFKQINKNVISPLMNATKAKNVIQNIDDNLAKINKPQLNDKQKLAIEKGLTNNRRAFLVSAPPGSGKTLAVAKPIIDTLREATKGKVYGGVVSNNASNILQKEIQADEGLNITKLVNGLRDGKIELMSDDIVCIDETSMIALKDATEIMEKIVNSCSRIVFIGDIRQLHSVGAGNAMDLIVKTLDDGAKSQLDKVVRQQNIHQAKVVEMIGDISDNKKLVNYTFNKLVKMNKQVAFKKTKNEALAKLMKDYVKSVKSSNLANNKIYAYTVDDVINLNNTAINILIDEGLVGANHIKAQYIKKADEIGTQKSYQIAIHEKSRIMFKDTFKYNNLNGVQEKIVNGQAGEVLAIIGSSVTIQMDDGRLTTVNTNTFKSLMPAMAQSLHSSQGDTVGKTFTYIDKTYTRKLLLIGVSRGKQDNQVYVNGDEETLKKVLKTDGNNTNVLKDIDKDVIAIYENEYNLAFAKNGNNLEKISNSIDFEKVKEKIDDIEIKNEDVISINKNNNNKGEENGKLPSRDEKIRSNANAPEPTTNIGNNGSIGDRQQTLQPNVNRFATSDKENIYQRENRHTNSLRENYIKQISNFAQKHLFTMQAGGLEATRNNNIRILPTDIPADMEPGVERGHSTVLSDGSNISREADRELDKDFDFFEEKLKLKPDYVAKTQEDKVSDGRVELAETLQFKPKKIVINPLKNMFHNEVDLNTYLVDANTQYKKISILDDLMKYDPTKTVSGGYAKIKLNQNAILMKIDNQSIVNYLIENKITNNEYISVLEESKNNTSPDLLLDLAKKDYKLFLEYCMKAQPPLQEVSKAISVILDPKSIGFFDTAELTNSILRKTSINSPDEYVKGFKNITLMNCVDYNFEKLIDHWGINPNILKNEYMYSKDNNNTNFNANLKKLFEIHQDYDLLPSINEFTKYSKNMDETTKQVYVYIEPTCESFLKTPPKNGLNIVVNNKVLFEPDVEKQLKSVGPQLVRNLLFLDKLSSNPNAVDSTDMAIDTHNSISMIFSRSCELSTSDKLKTSLSFLMASASCGVDIQTSLQNYQTQSKYSQKYLEEYRSKEGHTFYEELFLKSNCNANQTLVKDHYERNREPNKVADLAIEKLSSKENQIELVRAIQDFSSNNLTKEKNNQEIISRNTNLLQLTMNRSNRFISATKPSETSSKSKKSEPITVNNSFDKIFKELEAAMQKVNEETNKIKYNTDVYVALQLSISSFTKMVEDERNMDMKASKVMTEKKDINPKLYMRPGEDIKNQSKGRDR